MIMRSRLLFFCLVAALAAADQKADSIPSETPSGPVNGIQRADSAPTGSQPVPVPVLLTYDQLNAMTNEQRTAYANAFDQAQAQSNVDNTYISVAREGLKTADNKVENSATVTSYKKGESSYKSVDNGYISDITGFNRGNSNGRSDRGYSSTNKPSSYSSEGYSSGNRYNNDDGKAWVERGENGYGRGETGYRRSNSGYRSGENGYRSGESGYRNSENGYRSGENSYKSDENDYRRGEEEYGKGYRSDNKEENTQSGPYAYGYDDGHKSARGYSDSLPKDYPYRIIGLHGFVFEKRYSRASGLMNPITPMALAHIGYRQKKQDEIFVPPY